MIIDSHALYWWLEDESRLSPKVAEIMEEALADRRVIYVNPVTFCELRYKQVQGELETRIPVREWPDLLARFSFFVCVDLGPRDFLRAAELEWEHRDPADRLIAVTAEKLGMPVLTIGREFHGLGCPVEAIW